MDWARAVEINQIALSRVVAALVAMLGGLEFQRLPHAVYMAGIRILRPTEAALRRLIVIAARGLVVKPVARCPMQKGLVIAGKGLKSPAFRLFDTRKNFNFLTTKQPFFIMVKTHSANPFNPFKPVAIPKPIADDGLINAAQFHRRLTAVIHALETIPRQAQRMARWQQRRATLAQAKFTSAMRPGPPPGHRPKPIKDIDYILKECHALAFDTLKQDTS